jgi:hypothetical protein
MLAVSSTNLEHGPSSSITPGAVEFLGPTGEPAEFLDAVPQTAAREETARIPSTDVVFHEVIE